MVPKRQRATIEEKKEQIEFYFRISINWKEDIAFDQDEDEYTAAALLSLKGTLGWALGLSVYE